MTATDAARQQSTGRAVIRSVALPSEHGGWGFLFEPIILGLGAAFSWWGVLLAVSALGVFLIHQPLKIAIKDHRKGRRPPRLIWAQRFVVGYALLSVLPMVALLVTAPGLFLVPLAVAIPFAAVQLYYDAGNRSRYLVPELSGALGLAMIAPAIALLGGWAPGMVWVLWLILTMRAAASILYVRARLRLKNGNPVSTLPAGALHALALLVMIGLALTDIAPWLGTAAFGILLFRALIGLSRFRKDQPAKVIGFSEIGYGLLTVVLIAVGYRLRL